MVLEATMIIMDNSEFCRNGDFSPHRKGAQAEAIQLIFETKTNSNPESSMGLMSMGGGPEVWSTFTRELGQLTSPMDKMKAQGTVLHLSTAINTAALALKHRENKAQHQRIMVFICSPFKEDGKTLAKLGAKMKKNNIHVDVIFFGPQDKGAESRLEAFHQSVNKSGGSFYKYFAPSGNLLSDSLLAANLLQADGGDFGAGGEDAGMAMGAGQFDFGVNPQLDPELALVLRISLEEENMRVKKKEDEEAAKLKEQSRLEDIAEDDEKQPLLDDDEKEDKKKEEHDKPDKDGVDDADKMDTT